MITLFRNGNIWKDSQFVTSDLAIDDSHITVIGSPADEAAFDRVIDVTGQYLLPGIIDCHAHVTMVGGSHHMAVFFQENSCELTIEGMLNCKRMAEHGITSARDCGGKGLETLALRDFIDSGKLIGPRLLCSKTPIKVVGGHEPGCDITGPYEARETARRFLYEGVDFLKVMVTGGLGKAGEDPGAVEMEADEIQAIVREAKRHHKKVACHCHSREGMELLLEAGADSIEHATYLDEEINDRIIKQGVYIVPTFTPYEIAAAYGEERGLLMDTVLAARSIIGEKRKRFRQAYEQGVQIAFGRDSGGFFMDQGEFVDEMLYMEQAGMRRADIIKSATENAARLLGIWDDTGSLETGKRADILFLTANPLEDLTAFRTSLDRVCLNGRLLPRESTTIEK